MDDPVSAFAQQLGIQQNEEECFMWLAEVGFQSPLPPRWSAHADASTGYIYYVNRDDQGSSWQNPLVPYLKQVIDIGRAYMHSGYEGFFAEQMSVLWNQQKVDLDHWHGPFNTPDGRPYYVNSVTNLSSWEDPRIDAQYVFELQHSLLNSLEQILPKPASHVPRFGGESPRPKPAIDEKGAEIYTLEECLQEHSNQTASLIEKLEREKAQVLNETSNQIQKLEQEKAQVLNEKSNEIDMLEKEKAHLRHELETMKELTDAQRAEREKQLKDKHDVIESLKTAVNEFHSMQQQQIENLKQQQQQHQIEMQQQQIELLKQQQQQHQIEMQAHQLAAQAKDDGGSTPPRKSRRASILQQEAQLKEHSNQIEQLEQEKAHLWHELETQELTEAQRAEREKQLKDKHDVIESLKTVVNEKVKVIEILKTDDGNSRRTSILQQEAQLKEHSNQIEHLEKEKAHLLHELETQELTEAQRAEREKQLQDKLDVIESLKTAINEKAEVIEILKTDDGDEKKTAPRTSRRASILQQEAQLKEHSNQIEQFEKEKAHLLHELETQEMTAAQRVEREKQLQDKLDGIESLKTAVNEKVKVIEILKNDDGAEKNGAGLYARGPTPPRTRASILQQEAQLKEHSNFIEQLEKEKADIQHELETRHLTAAQRAELEKHFKDKQDVIESLQTVVDEKIKAIENLKADGGRGSVSRRMSSQALLEAASPQKNLAELQVAMSELGTRQKQIEDSIQDEEEAQRLRLRQRVEQRRQRKRSQTPPVTRGATPSSASQSPSNSKKFRPPPLLDGPVDASSGSSRPRPDGSDVQLSGGKISKLPVPGPPPLPGDGDSSNYFPPIPSPCNTPKGITSPYNSIAQMSNPRGSFSRVPLGHNSGLAAPPGATAEEVLMLGMEAPKPVDVTPRSAVTPRSGPQTAPRIAPELQREPSLEDVEDPLGATLR